jgi:hypothetical protein
MPADNEEKPTLQAAIEAILAELEKLQAKIDIEALRAKLEQLADKTDVDGLRAELERLRAEVAALKGPAPPSADAAGATPAPPPTDQSVTLDQIGAMVHRSKRTMERYRACMPPPCVQGRRGQASRWEWPDVRPWLEQTFGLRLPERFPGHPL